MGLITGLAAHRWPGGCAPYTYDEGQLSPTEIGNINSAVASINGTGAIRLIRRTTQTRYIDIIPDYQPLDGTCWSSHIGQSGARQEVKLDPGAGVGVIIHELCHALGISHEHQRPDRDTNVGVNTSAVKLHRQGDFAVKSPPASVVVGAYDFASGGQVSLRTGHRTRSASLSPGTKAVSWIQSARRDSRNGFGVFCPGGVRPPEKIAGWCRTSTSIGTGSGSGRLAGCCRPPRRARRVGAGRFTRDCATPSPGCASQDPISRHAAHRRSRGRGRIDDLVVALPRAARHIVRLGLRNFWCAVANGSRWHGPPRRCTSPHGSTDALPSAVNLAPRMRRCTGRGTRVGLWPHVPSGCEPARSVDADVVYEPVMRAEGIRPYLLTDDSVDLQPDARSRPRLTSRDVWSWQ